MIVTGLALKNFCQHRELDVKLGGTLVGLIGRNGTGKSNFLKAIQFGFTGEVPGKNKDDLISWGAAAGSMRMLFTHDGKNGEIYRELHTNKAHLIYAGEQITGITKVNAEMAARFGVDNDIWKQAVFVRQEELHTILFTQPAQRRQSWQKLCGLGCANLVYDRMGKLLTGLKPMTDFTPLIESTQKLMAENTAKLEEANQAILQLQQSPASSVDGIDKQIKMLQAVVSAEQLCAVRNENWLGAVAEEQRQTLACNELCARLPNDPEAFARKLTADADNCQKQISQVEQYQRLTSELLNRQAQLMNLKDTIDRLKANPPLPLKEEEVKPFLTACLQTIGQLNGELEAVSKLLTAISSIGANTATVCPLCQQPIANATTLIGSLSARQADGMSKLRAINADYSKVSLEYDARRKAADNYGRQLEQMARSLEVASNDITRVSAELSAIGSPQADRQALVIAHSELRGQYTNLLQLTTQASTAKSVLQRLKELTLQRMEELSAAKNSRNAIVCDVLTVAAANDRLTQLSADLTVARKQQQELAAAESSVKAYQELLSRAQTAMAEIEQRRKAQAEYEKVVKTLTTAREWFHHTNGPHVVIKSALDDLTAGTQDFLRRFEAEFSISPDYEAACFRYFYNDGRPVSEGFAPVTELSGGQKVMLAVSFRLATYCMFAARLGLLTLDEPTIWLDAENVDSFCRMLGKVREIAAKMNLQILISTHEPGVANQVDSCVSFGG